MKRFFQYFGFVAFISLLVYGASFLYEQFPKIVSSTLMVVGGVTLVALAIRLLVGKNWVIKMGREFFIGNDLIKALENFLKDMPNPKSETTANLVGHIIYRFTRLGLIGLVIAIIPAWLLYQQNQLFGYQNERIDKQTDLLESQDKRFERQNQLITSQNDFIKEQTGLLRSQDTKFGRQNEYILQQTDLLERQDRKFGIQNELLLAQNTLVDTQNYRLNLQNNLIEAERRSSLVFLMSNVLDKVDEEIREQKEEIRDSLGNVPDSAKFSLGKPLVSRIVALSRAFRPYRVLEGDTLSNELVSPERGQLFIALMENNLDSLTQNTIAGSGDFSNAIVGRVDLRGAKLRQANLIGVDLNHADLSGADLRFAYLEFANLHNAHLDIANLRGADLRDADLRFADLEFAKLKVAYLNFADLSGANLHSADLPGANLRGANLSGTDLYFADLSGANLSGANLSGADLNFADLSGANLDFADLSEASLLLPNLSGADLKETKVSTEQLKTVVSLYQVRNLHPDSMAILQSIRPCLFTEEGCK